MSHESRGGADRAAVGFGVGLLTGLVLGVGLGALLAPRDETRRHMAVGREPDRTKLAGVEGLSEPF